MTLGIPPEFVAVDGEAIQDGRYVLMRSSLGHELINTAGITTRQAFGFLQSLTAPGRVLVCYGLNYDVNQWIKDLSPGELRELWETQQTAHAWRYKLRWWPNKHFYTRDVREHHSFEVAEVIGYFQTSFVNALDQWGVGAPGEVAEMKARRATFRMSDLDRMRAYCLRECELLVELMNRLARSVYDAGLKPRQPSSARAWIGAGSLASTLLAANGVSEHHAHDVDIAPRETVEQAVLGAMFGGRIEMLAAGVIPRADSRDLRSAYPHAITTLPSLDGSKLKHRRRRAYRPGMEAIWRVHWDAGANRIAPFPARKPDKTIWYMARGEGCYHACEVDAAIKLGYQIDVREGWELTGHNPAPCFQFISTTYNRRARLKRMGHPSERALKLGLNSCYGKLAQGYGASGRLPRFQSYYWAGRITAMTRARLLLAAHRARTPAMIATDGIYAAGLDAIRPALQARLGTWEAGTLEQLFCAQPGVYHGHGPGGEVRRSRGFRSAEMDWEELRSGYEDHGLDHVQRFSARKFIGLGVALARRDPDVWRTWIEESRSLSLMPDRKRVGEADPRGFHPLHPFLGPICSEPYTPKQDLYDDPTPARVENMIANDQPEGTE